MSQAVISRITGSSGATVSCVVTSVNQALDIHSVAMEPNPGSVPFDFSQAVTIINVLRQAGLLEQVLEAASQSSNVNNEATTSGAMHDGCKRRLTEPSSSGGPVTESDFTVVDFAATQPPVIPGAGYKKKSEKSVTLPEGIESLSHWGKTVCTLPKFAGQKLTYEKLVSKAGTCQETKEYMVWVKNNAHKSPKVKDLKEYLEAVGYFETKSNTATYPGTDKCREFGS